MRMLPALLLCAAALIAERVEAGQCSLWLRYGDEEIAHRTACALGETVTVKLASMSLTYKAAERSASATLTPGNLIFFNNENRQTIPADGRTATPFYDTWASGFVSGGNNKPVGAVRYQFRSE